MLKIKNSDKGNQWMRSNFFPITITTLLFSFQGAQIFASENMGKKVSEQLEQTSDNHNVSQTTDHKNQLKLTDSGRNISMSDESSLVAIDDENCKKRDVLRRPA